MNERKRGKKIDVLTIKDGAQEHKVELRFDKHDGIFYARLAEVDFSAKTLEELKKKLQDKAHEMVSYEFKWYLRIRYDIEVAHNIGSSTGGYSFDELEDRHTVSGFDFRFEVVERSQAIKTDEVDYHDKPYWQVLERDIEEGPDGNLCVKHGEGSRFHKDKFVEGERDDQELIEFTPERYAKLKAIQAAMKVLAQRLHEIVGGEAKDVTRMLDKMSAQPLQGRRDELSQLPS